MPKLLGKLYAMPPHPAPWPHWSIGVPARVVTVPLSPPQPPSLLLLQDAGCRWCAFCLPWSCMGLLWLCA